MASATPLEDGEPAHPKPFRFKSTSSKRASQSRSRSPTSRSSGHHHHRHPHRSKRQKPSQTPQDNPFTPSNLDPETAFRESLFDALADDEGAAFWEGVYGQPIHTYPRPSRKQYPNVAANDPADMEDLDSMTDEDYVAYVRTKMWEKSHQHILGERRKREEERSRRKQRDEEARRWEKGVEEALQRGEERRRKAKWKGRWDDYLKGWEHFTRQTTEGDRVSLETEPIRNRIPWPVHSGLWQDVSQDEVERFFKHAPHPSAACGQANLLKLERVRWHPDKVQQKAGTRAIDADTMKTVTAVFQIIDRICSIAR